METATNVEVFEITYDEEERNNTGPAYEITRPINKMIDEDPKEEDMDTELKSFGSAQKGRLSVMPIPTTELHSLSFLEFDPKEDYKHSTRIGEELRGADSSVQQTSLQEKDQQQPEIHQQQKENLKQPEIRHPQKEEHQQKEIPQQKEEYLKLLEENQQLQPVEVFEMKENIEPMQDKQISPQLSEVPMLCESDKENADEVQAEKIKLPPGGWQGYIPTLGTISAKRPGPLESQSLPPNKKMNIGAELLSFKPPPPPTHLKTGSLLPKVGSRAFGNRLPISVVGVSSIQKHEPKNIEQTLDQENAEPTQQHSMSVVMKPLASANVSIAPKEKQRDTGVLTQFASLFRKSQLLQTQFTQVQEITMDFTKIDISQAEKTKEYEEIDKTGTNEIENETMVTQEMEILEKNEEAQIIMENNTREDSVVKGVSEDDNSSISSIDQFDASAFNISLVETDLGVDNKSRKSASSMSIRVSIDGNEVDEIIDTSEDDSSIADEFNVTNFERSIWDSPRLGDRTLANIESLNKNEMDEDEEQLTQYLDLVIDTNLGDSSDLKGNDEKERQRQLQNFTKQLDLRSMSMRIQALETDRLVVRVLWSTLEFRIRFGAPVRCSSNAVNNRNQSDTRGLQLIAEREIISVDVLSLYDGVESPKNMFSQLDGEEGTIWEPLIDGDWYCLKFKTPEDSKLLILAQNLVMEQFDVLGKTLRNKYPTSRSLVGLLKELSRIVQTPRSLCLELSSIIRCKVIERFEIQTQPSNIM